MPNLIPVDHDPFMGAASAAPNLIPVDHDPFADGATTAPNLIPVDHDPFGEAALAAPNLIPVDHDPFADADAAATNLAPVDRNPFGAVPPTPDSWPSGFNPGFNANINTLHSINFASPAGAQSEFSMPRPTLVSTLPSRIPRPWPAAPGYCPAPKQWPPPGPPPSMWDPPDDQGIGGLEGFLNFFRGRARGSGRGGGGDEQDCHGRYDAEYARCNQFLPFNDKGHYRACTDRASARRNMCIRNGGKPDPNEPPEYSWNEIPDGRLTPRDF
jgi:hypothetical protein